MVNKPVGLLWDSVSNNTGDKAIGQVMIQFLKQINVDFETLDPFNYDAANYSTMIIGGGELLRKLGDPFYDRFRVRGNHILNSVGTYIPDHVEYLNDYSLVTVRTTAEKENLAPIVPSVKTSPCVTTLFKEYLLENSTQDSRSAKASEVIGIQLHYGCYENIPDIITALRDINKKYKILFIPFTFYNNDKTLMQAMAHDLPDATVSELTEPVDIFRQISRLGMMISSSLHATIFSFVQNVPVLAFPYMPKVQAFMDERGLREWCFRNSADLSAKVENLLNIDIDYQELIEKDKQSVRDHLLEIARLVQDSQNISKVFMPQAPWVDIPDGADSYHALLMHYLSSTGGQIASRYQLKSQLESLKRDNATLQQEATHLNEKIAELTLLDHQQRTALDSIYTSRGWRFLHYLTRIRFKLAPPESFRDKTIRFMLRPHRFSFKEAYQGYLRGIRAWLRNHKDLLNLTKKLFPWHLRRSINYRLDNANDVNLTAVASPTLAQPGAALPENNLAEKQNITDSRLSDWDEYLRMAGRIKELKKSKALAVQVKPPKYTTIEEKDVLSNARSLHIPNYDKPEVSIIIPVHNNIKLTVECLLSIQQHTSSPSFEIIIVDDGSDLETQQVIAEIPNITVIHNDERIGFTLSCNRGAKNARCEYLLFLNNDVVVTDDWLHPLYETLRDQKNIGAAGPKVISPDGRLQEAGAYINMDGTATLIGYSSNPRLPHYNYLREVDYCSGVCLLVRNDLFSRFGGFDPIYAPAYYEDVDLCFKLRSEGYKVFYNPASTIIHHLSATTQQLDTGYKYQLITRNRQKFIERWRDQIENDNQPRLIAFYLPQYHPIPENDLWWGKGFTEWTNVARAQPNYVGHYQPHLPADLGFYDLRNPEIMDQQAQLAKRYGIYGFCYYYYWFGGKRLLEMPIERMLKTGKPDIPFCICWANENWSRRWDGNEEHLLMSQQHSKEDDQAVIQDMIRYFRHPNYIRVDDKPILLVYRVSLFPNFKDTTAIWRKACREQGIGEIQIVMAESFELSLKTYDPREFGADALVEFPPHNMFSPVTPPGEMINRQFKGTIMDYKTEALKYIQKDTPPYIEYKTVMPSWDNTARKQNASTIYEGSNPGAYQAWLEYAVKEAREQLPSSERIVFINAWNEWGEGNHLEPDKRFGHRYLEATRNALDHWMLKPNGSK